MTSKWSGYDSVIPPTTAQNCVLGVPRRWQVCKKKCFFVSSCWVHAHLVPAVSLVVLGKSFKFWTLRSHCLKKTLNFGPFLILDYGISWSRETRMIWAKLLQIFGPFLILDPGVSWPAETCSNFCLLPLWTAPINFSSSFIFYLFSKITLFKIPKNK